MVNKQLQFKPSICAARCITNSLKDHSVLLINHGRHGLLSFLSYLPIPVLSN